MEQQNLWQINTPLNGSSVQNHQQENWTLNEKLTPPPHPHAADSFLPGANSGQVNLVKSLIGQLQVDAFRGDGELERHCLVSLRHRCRSTSWHTFKIPKIKFLNFQVQQSFQSGKKLWLTSFRVRRQIRAILWDYGWSQVPVTLLTRSAESLI